MLENIDKRISYKIVLDCESCPLDKELQSVDPYNMFFYDLGWGVFDKYANCYRKRWFLNADIFLNEKELMKSAYYAKKIPQYWEKVKNGEIIIASAYNIRKQFLQDIEDFGVTQIYAHNMRFDYGTLTNTQRWLTKSKYRSFFPYGVEICDTLKMARDVLGTMPTYKKFCEENGLMTKHATPQPQFKAETIYKFLTNNVDFEESHTGLEDVMIEAEIMAYCYKQHKKMRRLLWEK